MSAILKGFLLQNNKIWIYFSFFSNGGVFFILFYSVLHHLFCIKTCYSVIMDVTQKWPTAWLFENVLESDGKMNLRYDTYILTAD